MGLFGSDDESEVSEEAQSLIDKATHKSVNAQRLTELKSGMMSRYLHDKPLIEYLKQNEQPHFILASRSEVPESEGNTPNIPKTRGSGMVMHMITDERWLVVASHSDGDDEVEIPLNQIRDATCSTGHVEHEIKLQLKNGFLTIPIGNLYDGHEIEAATSYINENCKVESEGADESSDNVEVEREVNSIRDSKRSDSSLAELANQASSDTVVEKRLSRGWRLDKALFDYLVEGEKPKYILSTWGIKVKIDDQSVKFGGKTSTKSALMITDMRIIAVNAEVEGEMIFSIDLEGISGGELNTASKLNPVNVKLSHTLTLYTTFKHLLMEVGDSGIQRLENDSDYQSLPVEITINFPLSGSRASKSDVKEAYEYISEKSEEFGNIPNKSKIFEYLDNDEELQMVTKGKKLEIVQGGETESQYAGKGVYAVVTDKRVFIVVGQRLTGSDIRNVPYDSIDGADIENNFVVDYLQIHSGSKTYRINIYDNKQANKSLDYIRSKIEGAQEVVVKNDSDESDNSGSDEDISEKLRELKQLNEEGILTDEEFEAKKQGLLDDF